MKCLENNDRRCYITKDRLDEYIDKMLKAEGILLGSPTYFGSVTAEMKMLIDRAGLVSMANGHLLRCKVGATLLPSEEAGHRIPSTPSTASFFSIRQSCPAPSIGILPSDSVKERRRKAKN
jgi:multimeric flavodoxin WrbA